MGKTNIGDIFHNLTIISREYKPDKKGTYWKCVCKCGEVVIVDASDLRKGNTKSCGCLKRKNSSDRWLKHGCSKEKLYNVWKGMRKRCNSPNNHNYKYYGERNISICDEWDDYLVFKKWAEAFGYKDGLSIERIDVNGNYCPENCMWADWVTQENNRRNNKVLELNGKKQTMAEWAREYNIRYSLLKSRIYAGWSLGKALSAPDGRIYD